MSNMQIWDGEKFRDLTDEEWDVVKEIANEPVEEEQEEGGEKNG